MSELEQDGMLPLRGPNDTRDSLTRLAEDYCSVSEAAHLIGITRQTIWRWVKREQIPFRKIGAVTIIERAGAAAIADGRGVHS